MLKLALAVIVLALCPNGARAQSQAQIQALPSYQQEGRDPYLAAITCNSSGWTTVISSDTIRRSLYIQALSTNGSNICLGTSTNGTNDVCQSTHAGIELATSANYTSYTREQVLCRSVQGSPVVKVKAARDRADYGQISRKP